MQKLKQLYRSNYNGEQVIIDLTLEYGDWNPVAERIPNSVFTSHTTTQAVVIGNGESRADFPLSHIVDHTAGLGGANRLQSYGCNALYRDFRPDFLIATGDVIIKEIAASGFTRDNIVYANADAVMKYPDQFYLIPQNIYFDAGALAAYMAAFDGHSRVFLLGFDSYDISQPVNNIYKNTPGYPLDVEEQNHAFWTVTLSNVISIYPEVDFVRVMPTDTWHLPNELAGLINLRQITYRDFVLEADIG
jgi:hypothetical protein